MYFGDFGAMAPYTYLLTRAQSDFEHNVLDLIRGLNVFDVVAFAEVEHDDRTHQLRATGQTMIDDAAGRRRHAALRSTAAKARARPAEMT